LRPDERDTEAEREKNNQSGFSHVFSIYPHVET
ncbi:unnamed protein product, partial [marine sediment metagenome]